MIPGIRIRRQFAYPRRAEFHEFPHLGTLGPGWESERDFPANLGIEPAIPDCHPYGADAFQEKSQALGDAAIRIR